MTPKKLRFRQVHLDFHTSPHIGDIGVAFDKQHWQDTLRRARVDSITLFAKCHHGWSYHPTQVGKMHPHLKFDLLRAQYDACREIDVRAPIYVSAGLDNVASHEHPEWREVNADGQYAGWARRPLDAGFHTMDFHSPYLDYLCAQIEEVVRLFPEADGIFLDIVSQNQSCGRWSIDFMLANGLDPDRPADRARSAALALKKYYERTSAACRAVNPDMPVFHNSGHVMRGERDILQHFSHLELESLPTGGWGYDHFPASAQYAANLGLDYLGMTGKFHTTWGEFGGYKHPNALRYECASMLALGAKCSIGDQLHPSGKLDESTYSLIEAAYREVEAKEAWCRAAVPEVRIAILSSQAEHYREAVDRHSSDLPDVGATRVLLEEHLPFTIIDRTADLSRYELVILPDDILIDAELNEIVQPYAARGGKLLMTGLSGLAGDRQRFAFEQLDADFFGESPFSPDYIVPLRDLRPSFVESPLVMYATSQRIKSRHGRGLGQIHDPYFNRSWRHFCSHQHAPPRPESSGYELGVHSDNLMYLAHPVFTLYQAYGTVAYREFIAKCLRRLLGERVPVETNLPSTARITVNRQEAEKRSIVHLLYANTINRGGGAQVVGGAPTTIRHIEVIEELLPLRDVEVSLLPGRAVGRATLEPQGREIPLERDGERVRFRLPELVCHQMVVLHDA